MKRVLITLGAAFTLTACSLSTGILSAGPDTFSLTEKDSPILGGSIKAQQSATVEAQAYCQKQGRIFLAVNQNETAPRADVGSTGYSLMFKCLTPGTQ